MNGLWLWLDRRVAENSDCLARFLLARTVGHHHYHDSLLQRYQSEANEST